MTNYVYNNWIGNYPFLVKDLDNTYGGPNYNKRLRPPKGRNALHTILEYLSTHRSSTCEEIATNELKKSVTRKTKLKSITDDFRKFIQEKLIPRRMIIEEGFKKRRNKNIQAYSLSPFGILYSIHLLSGEKAKHTVVNSIAIEYQDILPNVFRKFPLFEKVLGREYLNLIGLYEIADNGDKIPGGFSDTTAPLLEFVNDSGYGWKNFIFRINRTSDQISLLVYTKILAHFVYESIFSKFAGKSIGDDEISKLWNQLVESEPEIKKWYTKFVKEALAAHNFKIKTIKKVKSWL